ncbi:MAG: hypothetical protein HY466_05460 [Deltaproteobacteria bacterium]|nr:hypothetical protein [Deltaproteobacteria bacterium]
MRSSSSFLFSVFLLLILVLSPWSVVRSPFLHATMVLPSKEVSVEKQKQSAQIAFKGTCVEKREEKVQGVSINIFSFRVEEALKGDVRAGEVYEVRQSGARNRQEASKFGVSGLSAFRFQTGQKYLLFLGEPRRYGIQPVLGGPKRSEK